MDMSNESYFYPKLVIMKKEELEYLRQKPVILGQTLTPEQFEERLRSDDFHTAFEAVTACRHADIPL